MGDTIQQMRLDVQDLAPVPMTLILEPVAPQSSVTIDSSCPTSCKSEFRHNRR
ncbi:hypothetical protein DPMN_019000 [Dreissena polymorpha]|uniref:Uncharacterized protein n=1 Tax=Dreissena polymorpha TaxID=45954 RepID=A0A9D4S7T0_DREPO|nr:hypothetical protein DPMN_019000 [Dreissena polymorpha]